MKATVLALALLALGVGLADTASATCYVEKRTVDPVPVDTGTAVDKVVVTYGVPRCEPPPP